MKSTSCLFIIGLLSWVGTFAQDEGNDKYATYFDEEVLERTDEFLVKFGFMDP